MTEFLDWTDSPLCHKCLTQEFVECCPKCDTPMEYIPDDGPYCSKCCLVYEESDKWWCHTCRAEMGESITLDLLMTNAIAHCEEDSFVMYVLHAIGYDCEPERIEVVPFKEIARLVGAVEARL